MSPQMCEIKFGDRPSFLLGKSGVADVAQGLDCDAVPSGPLILPLKYVPHMFSICWCLTLGRLADGLLPDCNRRGVGSRRMIATSRRVSFLQGPWRRTSTGNIFFRLCEWIGTK